MSILEALKSLIGITTNQYDGELIAISMVVVLFFVYTLFNILNSMFRRKY